MIRSGKTTRPGSQRRPLLLASFFFLCLVLALKPAHADRFKAIAEIFGKLAEDEAKLAGKAARAEQGAAESAWVADALKAEGQLQTDLLPLEFDDAGRVLDGTTRQAISSTDELVRLSRNGQRDTKVIVQKSDAFAHGDELNNLIGDGEFLVVDTGSGTIHRARFERLANGRRVLRIESRTGVWVDAATEGAFRLGQEMLDHATPVHRVDLVSFFDPADVRISRGFSDAAGASHRALNGSDADKLIATVGQGRNRVIMVVSHVEDGVAVVRTPGGKVTGSVPLEKLQAAADASDNTLVFLGCSTSRTPVGGFISPVRTDPILQSVKSVWHDGQLVFGDFLSKLGQQGGGFVVNAAQAQSLRRTMTVRPLDTSGGAAAGLILTRGSVNQMSRDRELELEGRLFPFIPISVQIILIFSGLMLLFGIREPWRSWVSVTGASPGNLPAGLSKAIVLIGFMLFGALWSAIVRIGSKLYKPLALVTGASWGLLTFTSVESFIINALTIGLFAGVYLGLFADREPEGIWERTKAVVIFATLFAVVFYAITALLFLPVLLFEIDNPVWALPLLPVSFVLSLWLLIRVFKASRERPGQIFERLWSDPFWPFRQLRPTPDQEAVPA